MATQCRSECGFWILFWCVVAGAAPHARMSRRWQMPGRPFTLRPYTIVHGSVVPSVPSCFVWFSCALHACFVCWLVVVKISCSLATTVLRVVQGIQTSARGSCCCALGACQVSTCNCKVCAPRVLEVRTMQSGWLISWSDCLASTLLRTSQ